MSWSLDHVGPIARSSRDVAALLEVLSGHSFALNETADTNLKDVRLGIDPHYLEQTEVQPAVLEAFRLVCDVFRSAGAEIIEIKMPDIEHANSALLDILLPEASLIHEENLLTRRTDFAPETLTQLEQGLHVSATVYLKAQRFQRALQRRFAELFLSVDALLMPTVPWVAPAEDPSVTGDEGAAEMHFTGPFNLLGLPALSVLCSLNGELPIGLQIVTGYKNDARALNLGVAFDALHSTSPHGVNENFNS